MRGCQICITVLLCLWSEVKPDTIKCIILFHAFDYNYNRILLLNKIEDLGQIVRQGNKRIQEAEEFADNENQSTRATMRSDTVNHYQYIQSTLNKNELGSNRFKIMLNIYVTFKAYQTAVYFYVSALYYSIVESGREKMIKQNMDLLRYMNWFFTLLLKEKVEGLCDIENYAHDEQSTFYPTRLFTAQCFCPVLRTLSLNNLKDIQSQYFKDDFYNLNSASTSAASANTEFQIKQRLYAKLWSTVYQMYDNQFVELIKYINFVFEGIDELDFAPSFSLHEAIQNRLDQFIDIKNLLPDIPRTTFSGYGNYILRSNAIEIMRQIQEIKEEIKPDFNKGEAETIYGEINSGEPAVHLEYAMQDMFVDYVMKFSDNL